MYDEIEQIYGYQYTGIMNSPDFRYRLGGIKQGSFIKDIMSIIRGL